MQSVLVDTGPLVALFAARDHHHPAAVSWFKGYRGNLLTTWPVLVEVTHLIDRRDVVERFMQWAARGGVQLFELPPEALPQLAALMARYRRPAMDLADASLVWLAGQLGLTRVLTIDEGGFAAYRTHLGHAFTNEFPVARAAPRGRR